MFFRNVPCFFMFFRDSTWFYMILRDFSPCFMILLDFHGCSWFSMSFREFPWFSVIFHDFPWLSINQPARPVAKAMRRGVSPPHGRWSSDMSWAEMPWMFRHNDSCIERWILEDTPFLGLNLCLVDSFISSTPIIGRPLSRYSKRAGSRQGFTKIYGDSTVPSAKERSKHGRLWGN